MVAIHDSGPVSQLRHSVLRFWQVLEVVVVTNHRWMEG